MKVVILNKKEFQELFPFGNPHNLSHADLHKELYNLVRNNFESNNKIEVISSVYYRPGTDSECLFQFEGKNKDIFFFSFLTTAA